MKKDTKRKDKHLLQIEDLRMRLEEAEETLHAIRKGEVDALIASSPQGDQIYTLKGAEQPYRVFVETMNEGAVTLGPDGAILYCNNRFGELLKEPLERIIGSEIVQFIAPADRVNFESALQSGRKGSSKIEILLKRGDGQLIPVDLSLRPLEGDHEPFICMVVMDLTERKRAEQELKESEEQLRHLASQLITAQEDERRRIAHDIHDSLGSQLSAVKFKVEDVFKTMPGASESIASALQEAINECRRIQMDLHPSMLEDLGIAPTLAWFCRRFETTYPVRIEQQIAIKESEVSKSLKRVIYRVSQEALNNIAKHSQANLVRLSLQKNSNTIELIIQDNGQGFELAVDTPKRGLGLSSMRERTESSGGAFSIQSGKGKGTVIRVSWPLGR
ncbi:MAG: PAS domain-containing sensor histidine kinase [Syntrophales bacterium]